MINKIITALVCVFLSFLRLPVSAQHTSNFAQVKPISKDLFDIFSKDLSYAANGGLYAELVQNCPFEYSPSDNKAWNPLTSWEYITSGYGYPATKDAVFGKSCVKDSKIGDLILKLVNAGSLDTEAKIDLPKLGSVQSQAILSVLSGKPNGKDTQASPRNIIPINHAIPIKKKFTYTVPAYSCSVIRIKSIANK